MTRADNVIELKSVRERTRSRASGNVTGLANRPSRSRDDKRMHPRQESDDRLFVQVVLSATDPELVGTTVSCDAINLSVGGIQFRTNAALPAGTLLDLWVDIKSHPGKFFLAGEVRWSRPATPATAGADQAGDDDRDWVIGVQLKSGAATDILDWRDFHAQASAR
jgi:Tfp pilus assembly protein PilZ